MPAANDIDLQSLFHEIVGLIGKNKQFSSVKDLVPNTKSQQDRHLFQAPIKGSYYNSGDFSPNAATDARHSGGHKGVDLRAAGGTAIYPIAPGIVTAVGTDAKGGNVINISHINGVRAYYAHLGTVKVHKGDRVGLNTIIATMGSSGNAQGTFPHLHIQVWKDNQLINPGQLFNVPAYSKVDPSKEKVWLSDRAKTEAANFNMAEHKEQKVAHERFGDLMSLADLYEDLAK